MSARPAWAETAQPSRIEQIARMIPLAFDLNKTPEGEAHWVAICDRLLRMVGECRLPPPIVRPATVRAFSDKWNGGNLCHAFDTADMLSTPRVVGWGATEGDALAHWDSQTKALGEELGV